MMQKRRVAITGLGVISPLGCGIHETFDALIDKRCGIDRINTFDPSHFDARIAGAVTGDSVKDCVPKNYRKATKVMARDIEIAVIAAYHAVKDAGLKTKCLVDRGDVEGGVDVDSTRFGANIGAGLICADLNELAGALATSAERPDAREKRGFSLRKWGVEGMNNLTPLWLLKFLPNMLACHVTIVHDCQAPSNTITCGEASSHLAIGEAFRTIERGAADICICGGAESKLNPMGLMRQSLLKRLATEYNDRPNEACRPFELVGFGAATNASHWLEPQPDGRALSLAVNKALDDAGASADEVELVAPLGTGTVAHDASEAAGIRTALGKNARDVSVMANKGSLGNNGAGSGAIDAALMIMAVHRGAIPPSLNTDKVDPDCGLNVVRGDPIDARPGLGLTVAQSMSGGQTAALLVRRYAG